MSSLARYRILIPAHVAVSDALVSAMLELAASRHDPGSFGAVYVAAMIYWAAHRVQRTPGSGAPGAGTAVEVGAISAQSDGDLSRTYATAPAGGTGSNPTDDDLRTTRYGLEYLDLRNSRAAAGPTFVAPWE